MPHKKYAPVVEAVEALQITAKNAKTVSQFLHGIDTKFVTGDGRETDAAGDGHRVAVLVPTGTGQALAVEGDYITKAADGSFAVFTQDVFERTHREVALKAAPKPAKGKK